MTVGAVVIGTFAASAVETIEMVTIVVGVGVARKWRPTLVGAASGFVVLAALVAGLRQALSLIPLNPVRIVIGALLLTFGLQWLRKGILQVADAGFWGGGEEEQEVEAGGAGAGFDWTAFVLSFKGVLLEGLEIAFIVVAFGAGSGSYTQALIGAGAAVVLIGGVGIAVRGQLEKLPGRTLKFAVGGLLTTFGTFWSLEGLGVAWPGGDISLAVLYPAYLIVSFALLEIVRRGLLAGQPPDAGRRAPGSAPAAVSPRAASSAGRGRSAAGTRARPERNGGFSW